jgi:SLT domain-containing protein/phage-related tail protein
MAWGGQKGLNFSQEMFDNLSEYSPLYKSMGFSAEEYFKLLQKGSDSGVYNLDYINDAMKEFQIRTVRTVLKLHHKQWGNCLKDTQKVFKDYQNGKATVKELHNSVVKDLKGMDNQVKANQLGISLYGTKFEDMGADSIYALGGINGKLKDVNGAMKRSGDNVDKTFSQKLQVAWRDAQADLVPLGEKLLDVGEKYLPKITDAIGKMTDKFTHLSPQMQNLVIGVGGFAALIGPVVLGISSIAGAVATSSLAVGGFAGAIGLLTNPVGLTIGALALLGLGYLAVDKAMDKPIIKSDIFKGKISDTTKKVLGSYTKLKDDSENTLNEMAWSHEKITDNMVKNIVGKYQDMTDQIMIKLDDRYNKEKTKMLEILANDTSLTKEEKAKILAEMDDKHQKQRDKVTKYQAEEEKIIKESKKKTGTITQEASRQVNEIEQKKFEVMIAATVKNSSEQQKILKNLKSQSGVINTEKAADTVKLSQKERDESIKEANKKYKGVKEAVEYERDVTGSISDKQAKKIIDKAKEAKDKSVAHAEDMHYEVVKQAQAQSGEHVSEVNWETGSVLSKWDMMWNGIADVWNPIADLFGLNRMKKRGVFQVNGRQRQKDIGASFAAYADGTTNGTHEGGFALVGEEGYEMAHIPNQGYTMLGVGGQQIIDLPKGSSVLPHDNTKALLRKYNFPAYKDGVGDFSLFTKGAKGIFDYFMNKTNFYGKYSMPSWFASIDTIMDKIGGGMVKKIDEVLGSMMSFGDGKAGSGVERWAGLVSQALKMTGQYSASNLQRLLYQMNTESSGNPRAINLWDSNAKRGTPSKGLMQVIDPTFRRYALPPFNKNIYDPLSNILASIRYALANYGSLSNAYRGVGYATGGEINNPQIAKLGENGWKEWVITSEPKYRQNNIAMWKKAGDSLGVNTASGIVQPQYIVNQIILNGRMVHEEIKKLDKEQTKMRNMFKGV